MNWIYATQDRDRMQAVVKMKIKFYRMQRISRPVEQTSRFEEGPSSVELLGWSAESYIKFYRFTGVLISP